MQTSLNELRQRSQALAENLKSDEALAVHAAILEAAPEDVVAACRLGIGLLNAGRWADATEVLETGVANHPDHPILRKRLAEARRSLARGDRPAPAGPRRARTPARSARCAWIKAMHFHEDWTVRPGELSWISDAGVIDASGRRVYRADGQPRGEPSWSVGDPVGLYYGGTYKVPVLVEVAATPRFDPEFVATNSRSGASGDGERWPWVTEVRGVAELPLGLAPTLTDLGIEHSSMQQRSRLRLSGDQHGRLVQLLMPSADA